MTRGWLLRVTGPIALVATIAFTVGVRDQSRRISAVRETGESVDRLLQAGRAQAWGAAPGAPEARPAADLLERVEPDEVVRLAVPRMLTTLAARAGIERVALRESDPASGDAASAREAGAMAGDGATIVLAPHRFVLRFEASYDALATFLAGLDASDRLIEVGSVSIERSVPLLDVTLEIIAYGRVS
jgi:hypothetical protein